MSPLILALIGTICWGTAPIFGKLGLANEDALAALCVRTLIAGGIVMGWLVLTGQSYSLRNIMPQSCIFIAIEALLATLVGDLAYYAALKNGNAGSVMLVMSTSPLITLVLALVFLREEPTWNELVGAIFIVLGLVLVAGPKFP